VNICYKHLKALVFLYGFEESVDCHLLSSFCDDSNLHISLFKYVLSTMCVSKESISKFLIGSQFHEKLRILNFQDWGCVILREIDFLLKICWSIPCLHPLWKVHICYKQCQIAHGKIAINYNRGGEPVARGPKANVTQVNIWCGPHQDFYHPI